MNRTYGVRLIFVTMVSMSMTELLVIGVGQSASALAPPQLGLVRARGLGTYTGLINFFVHAVSCQAILVAEGLNTTAR